MMTDTLTLNGIFGGTFDPIHNGHLIPLQQAAEIAGLDRLSLMPCHIPPHKETPSVSSAQRLAMVKIACENSRLFYADDRELLQDRPSYTVNTLKALKRETPDDAQCFFMGMDSLQAFNSWYHWEEILSLCHLVVCKRPGSEESFNSTMSDVIAKRQIDEPALLKSKHSGHIFIAETDEVDVSATQIRHQIQQGKAFEHLVPNAVAEYIKTNGLYLRGSDKLSKNP